MASNSELLTHSNGKKALHKIKFISEEELRRHNQVDDIWISIRGKVYNVSDWVNFHPGGRLPFMFFAGQEITDVFLASHPKSSTTSSYLELFFTGYHLQNYKVSEISQDYRKLHGELQNMGLFEKKGHTMFFLMTIALMTLILSVFGVLYTNYFWVHVASAVLMGFTWIQLGFIMHDCGHYQTMMNRKLNRFALLLVSNCLTGVSGVGFKRHHTAHHISTNTLDFDPDTYIVPTSVDSSKYFTSLTSKYHYKKKYIRVDTLSKFFIVTVFGRLYAYSRTFHMLFNKKAPNRCMELLGVFVFWIWYSLLLSCLPNWFERTTFVVVAICVTAIQTFQFSLNHFSKDVYIGAPTGNDDWVKKQIIATLNIESWPWMDWFHGGLNFQIEHHLFPRMPRYQLRRISPFVKELCRKHNLPYNCANSFWDASMLTINSVRGFTNINHSN